MFFSFKPNHATYRKRSYSARYGAWLSHWQYIDVVVQFQKQNGVQFKKETYIWKRNWNWLLAAEKNSESLQEWSTMILLTTGGRRLFCFGTP